ncbi:DNA helicase [Tanacetum coccineum]
MNTIFTAKSQSFSSNFLSDAGISQAYSIFEVPPQKNLNDEVLHQSVNQRMRYQQSKNDSHTGCLANRVVDALVPQTSSTSRVLHRRNSADGASTSVRRSGLWSEVRNQKKIVMDQVLRTCGPSSFGTSIRCGVSRHRSPATGSQHGCVDRNIRMRLSYNQSNISAATACINSQHANTEILESSSACVQGYSTLSVTPVNNLDIRSDGSAASACVKSQHPNTEVPESSSSHVQGYSTSCIGISDFDQQCHPSADGRRGISRQRSPATSSQSSHFNRNVIGQRISTLATVISDVIIVGLYSGMESGLKLYIYDTQNEVGNGMHHFGNTNGGGLNPEIVERLIRILDEHNELVRLFISARDKCRDNNVEEFKIRLYNMGGLRGYELPTSQAIGGITGFYSKLKLKPRDGIGRGKQVGFYSKLKLKPRDGIGRGKQVTMNVYYKYQLHPRVNDYGLIFKGGRLFQQYVVAVYCAIEQSRIDFIRTHQSDIRSEYLSGLYDDVLKGDLDGVILAKLLVYLVMTERGISCLNKLLLQQPLPKLNNEQRKIYDLIMNATSNNQQELIFVYGHGEHEKHLIGRQLSAPSDPKEDDDEFLHLDGHLEEIHVTWAHLEKKRPRLRLYTKSLKKLCIQSVKTASRVSSNDIRMFEVTALEIW